MSADVGRIPSFGFARGTVVRRRGSTNHMIVVRGFAEKTACVFCDGDEGGTLRFLEFDTHDLEVELATGIPAAPEYQGKVSGA